MSFSVCTVQCRLDNPRALPALEKSSKLILLSHSRVYAVIASDGIWEFIDYSKVVDLTSKKTVPEMLIHEPEQIKRW